MRYTFSVAEREGAKAAASERDLAKAKVRSYLGALGRETFSTWARFAGLPVSTDGTYSAIPDLAELLDVTDLIVAGRRVFVGVQMGPGDRFIKADRRALASGFAPDLFAFVELGGGLAEGQVLGVVPTEAFVEEGWLDSSGQYLLLGRNVLRGLDVLPKLLEAPPYEPSPLETLDHEEVFDRIPAYELGEIPPEDCGPFERHLFACNECRRHLIAGRYFLSRATNAFRLPEQRRAVHKFPVMISYSRADSAAADELIADLGSFGIPAWCDREMIPGGKLWRNAIVSAIDSCTVVLFLASHNSMASEEVPKELEIATEAKKAILPVCLDDSPFSPQLRHLLAGIHRVELFKGDRAQELRRIVENLAQLGVEKATR